MSDISGVPLWYNQQGDPLGPPVVLLAGLGDQSIAWDGEVVEALARAGYRVIMPDNRDVGLSPKFDAVCPDPEALVARLPEVRPAPVYTFSDMAADVKLLLDTLEIPSAHLVGISSGGSIAQRFNCLFPTCVKSCTTILSDPGVKTPALPEELVRMVLAPVPRRKQEFLKFRLKILRLMAGTTYPFPEVYHYEREARAFDRSDDALGRARQLLTAVNRSSDCDGLKRVHNPFLVVLGEEDCMTSETAETEFLEAIPHASIHRFQGFGHAMHPAFHEELVGVLSGFLRYA